MYVDDFLGGAQSIESAKSLIEDLIKLFNAGGFELRKWSSNEPHAISHLPDSLKASSIHQSLNPDSSQRILGLEWNLQSDTLRVQVTKEISVNTKRELLSVIAKIFDPLGILAPSTLLLKTLLQEVWKTKLSWDDPLPTSIQQKWDKFYSQIHSFNSMFIPRFIHLNSSKCELHGFCDSSTQAYSAVVYLKTIDTSVKVSLVAAKTRIAPVRQCTLPRLELCSALLLSELVQAIQLSLAFPVPVIYLWTDSTITLNWILNPPQKGNQFVLHRANKIRNLTSLSDWHHIPGKHNPADIATRGVYPEQLEHCESWWLGPTWLHQEINPSEIQIATRLATTEDLSPLQTLCYLNQNNQVSDSITKSSIAANYSE